MGRHVVATSGALGGADTRLPIETVLAEKSSTAIALGEANTRVRDYVDLFVLTGKHSISYDVMYAALNATMKHRGVSVRPLSEAVGDLGMLRQSAYNAFRGRLGPDGVELPATLTEIVAVACGFVDPLVDESNRSSTWWPEAREWGPPARMRDASLSFSPSDLGQKR